MAVIGRRAGEFQVTKIYRKGFASCHLRSGHEKKSAKWALGSTRLRDAGGREGDGGGAVRRRDADE